MNKNDFKSVSEMFSAYRRALEDVEGRIGENFFAAVDMIASHDGNFIICGMGKSGLVGQKIAATLTSTGTPSVFLHPAEAIHGDLGIVRKGDVILLISNSGETDEVIRLLPALRRIEAQIISLVGNPNSTMAKASKIVLDASIDREACPLNLAPTTSTLAALVLGDALAIALMKQSGFREEDFARTHPGGKLGRKLLSSVKDHMRSTELPFVSADMPMTEVILAMTEGRLGLAIVGTQQAFQGIITDGDLRRMLVQRAALDKLTAGEVMNVSPLTISEDASFGEAEELLIDAKIQCLLVTDSNGHLSGVLQIF
ncbi:MAG: KpsF/GutQ family sugar-phosphate isomerase [Candidatus Puniceispirillaceae bacterium]